MFRYGSTIFLSAFLLFLVQPMIAKFILPWFGGTAVVWTTCMVYFQVVLLFGYMYAHLLRKFLSPRAAWTIHVCLLAVAVAITVWLRGIPPDFLKPTGGENLTWAIFKLLTITVGLPFFLLSSTGPLVQAWHSLSHGGRTYRLYALSNTGSILALFCYPFVVERMMRLTVQSTVWSCGFVAFGLLCAVSGLQAKEQSSWKAKNDEKGSSNEKWNPNWLRLMAWVILAMAPSVMMMATTNLMSQEVASIPFLWILPLSLYLISLIVCFDRPVLYRRFVFVPLLIVGAIVAVLVLQLSKQLSLLPQVIGLSLACFACSMSCHGELERLKPPPQHLTLFYLFVSLGGALGGIFVVVVSPQIFVDVFEFHVGLSLSVLSVAIAIVAGVWRSARGMTFSTWLTGFGSLIAVTCVGCSVVYLVDASFNPNLIDRQRNEYGLVQILEKDNYRAMINGRTEHGGQYTLDSDRMKPSSYYTNESGPALAFRALSEDPSRANTKLRVGVVGLGTGSMVTVGPEDTEFWFYEINPVAEYFARKYFSYLDETKERTNVVIGDGRIQLERQLQSDGPLGFDILVLDAFNSDSIPAHLLTRESFELYWKHLKKDGILIAHITNVFVDVRPVVYSLATEAGYEPILFENHDKYDYDSRWVLITANEAVKNSNEVTAISLDWPQGMNKTVWTDDFASLAQVVDWSFKIKWNKSFFSTNVKKKSSKSSHGQTKSKNESE